MESYVNCPECGEQVQVVMKPYDGLAASLMIGLCVGKSGHFEGEATCKCGKRIISSLHVTAD